MNSLASLALRFRDVDVQSRRWAPGSSWPRQWRARIGGCLREYRLTAWGDDIESAVAGLVAAVARVDEEAGR